MNVSQLHQPFRIIEHGIYVFFAPDCSQSRRICRLYAYFHLKKPLSGVAQKLEGSVVQQIGTDFKMKVGHSVVVIYKVLKNLVGPLRPRVEGPVDELHLHRLFIQKVSQLALHSVEVEKAHRSFRCRKTVGTSERTAPRRFIVDHPILLTVKNGVGERYEVEVHRLKEGVYVYFSLLTVNEPRHRIKSPVGAFHHLT